MKRLIGIATATACAVPGVASLALGSQDWRQMDVRHRPNQ